MTKQETFDKVVAHLREQGVPAKDVLGEACVYRDAVGRKCAVGCLIPDDMYSPDLEGVTVKMTPVSTLMKHLGHSLALLEVLQDCHDFSLPEHWEGRFKEIAKAYRLTYIAPQEAV